MSFSSTFSPPLLIITTVALALLVEVCRNFLEADYRLVSLCPSFISAHSTQVDGELESVTASVTIANGAPESRKVLE